MPPWPFEGIAAEIQHIATVRQGQRGAGVLLDHEDGDAGGVDLGHLLEHGLDEHRREAGRRLVQQQDAGLGHQGPGHGHHLALAAGHGAHELLAPLAQAREEPQQLLDARSDLGARAAHGAELEILDHGHVLEDVLALGHIAQPQPHDLMGPPAGDLLAAQQHPAAARRHQADDGFHQGGFARPVGTHHGDDLAGIHRDGDAVQDIELGAVARHQLLGLEHARCVAHRAAWPR